MALYYPATTWYKASEICKIPRTETNNGITVYVIEVNISSCKWFVRRRYRDFAHLHQKLSGEHVDKNLLPPKKYFGSQMESFIAKRRADLELYLHALLHQFSNLPPLFAKFLDFHIYEIKTIITNLTEKVYIEGDSLMYAGGTYELSPLELYAITERLKLAEPTCATGQGKHDLGHLLSFISELKKLRILGSSVAVGDSNIIPNNLLFNLKPFKSLVMLEISNCDLQGKLESTDPLQKTLSALTIHDSLSDMSAFTLSGVIHWSPSHMVNKLLHWDLLTHLDLSHNSLSHVHSSVELFSVVEHLNLSFNSIKKIEHLEKLPHLTKLDLSFNKIQYLDSLHLHLGNIHSLLLSRNSISSLKGLSRLYSLVNLKLDGNLIASLDEITRISKLPCLESLDLSDNPISSTVDFRSNVLLLFGTRASEMCLDGLQASAKEVDTVAVLQALQISKQGQCITDNMESPICSEKVLNCCSSHSAFNTIEFRCNQKRSSDISKFHQELTILRKIGGPNWLRLLNNIQKEQSDSTTFQDSGLTFNLFNGSLDHHLKYMNSNFCSSKSHSYPYTTSLSDYVFSFEKSQWRLNNKYLAAFIEKGIDQESFAFSDIQDILWLTCTVSQLKLRTHFPVCLILLHDKIVVFKCDTEFCASVNGSQNPPKMSLYLTIFAKNVVSLIIGPCKAYFEFETVVPYASEKHAFVIPNTEVTINYISILQSLYNFVPQIKSDPFSCGTLNLDESFNLCYSDSYFQKEVLFCKPFFVLKISQNCDSSAFHYLVVTASHVVLIEEINIFSNTCGFKCMKKLEYCVCSFVCTKTNIITVYLSNCSKLTSNSQILHTQFNFDSTTGSSCSCCKSKPSLYLEFCSGAVVNGEFLCYQDRNEFLNAFLSSRLVRM